MGWYYCENTGEDNGATCYGNIDNDGDGKIDEDETAFSDVPVLSFQQGCDCLSYPDDALHLQHFCTVPCAGTCPAGFECTQIFENVYNLPGGMSNAYCVPTDSVQR